MRKSVIFLLLMSIITSICYGVFAEETPIYKIEGYENTYVDGDFIYDAETNKIVKWVGNSKEVVIPEYSVLDVEFKFLSRGLRTAEGFEKPEKFIVSEGVVIEGSLDLYKCETLEVIEFYNDISQMKKVFLGFEENKNLKTLRLPEGLEKVNESMCQDLKYLTDVYIPDSVKTIEKNAFSGCTSIGEVKIPDDVEEIGEKAFSNCVSLHTVELPSNIKKLGNEVFEGCNSISSWYIPGNIDYSLLYMHNDVDIIQFEIFPEYTKEFYQHFWDTDWFKKNILPQIKDDFLVVDGYLIKYLGTEKIVEIPDNVKVVCSRSFKGTNVEYVNMNKAELIEQEAFGGNMSIREVVFTPTVKYIEEYAFRECYNLNKLSFEGDCTLESGAFYDCTSLRDSGISVNGELTYTAGKYVGGKDPFMFTDTSYAIERIHIDTTPPPTTPPVSTEVPTEQPSESPTVKPTEQPTEKPTETPTSQPEQTSTPQEKEVIKVVSENNVLTILADEEEIEFTDAFPFIDEHGRTQIPIRAVGEALGCNVDWNETERKVTLTKGDLAVTITIDSNKMTTDEKEVEMDTTAKIIGERTYIPLRFAGEALGFDVVWVVK